MSRKLPSKLSVEDLLTALGNEEISVNDERNPEVSVGGHDILGFLSYFKLAPGTHPLKPDFLYKLYKEWSDNPTKRRTFSLFVSNFFSKNASNYILVDKDYFTICKELYILLNKTTVDKTKYPKYQQHFNQFLEIHKIKQGKTGQTIWVETFILFYLYDKWTYKTKKKKPLGYNQFHNFCCLHFRHKRRGVNRVDWFQVDPSILENITEDKMEEIRQARKRHYEKNYPKRKSQIPRS